jgi:phenylalanyl-tRNA synthetase alpha chain
MRLDEIGPLREQALSRIRAAKDLAALEAVRVEWLGRKAGRITALLKSIPTVAADERARFGQAVNDLKSAVAEHLAARRAALEAAAPRAGPRIDVTLPGRRPPLGRMHPITRATREMVEIFGRLGFEVVEGLEVEDEWHNFVGLNIPPEHPARDPLDNYYLNDRALLRTQTSTVQVRVMEKRKPPVRIIAPGRVYRPDTVDASHSNMFHQLEGLWVEQGVTFADLKGVLAMFARAFFGPQVRTRFQPSYFPFTEPSAEMYVSCLLCGGDGCPACKRKGWMEILGCGMVDPNVFEAVGYDPEQVTGFAFGMGIDRQAMLKYAIHDIRLFFENDVRFLRQF